ncbi:MAG: PLDc N-terminal domain-containing protein [Haliea sp.]|nr:PLDc N-terminal domain-containing protein [Haliea sp.]MBK6740901.1 PLDc N-terminal domain-containing protein [Haliea sp.]
MELGGIVGLVIIVVDLWAILRIIGSSAPVSAKILWSLLIIVLPVVGLIIWFVAGPQ